VDNIEKGLEIEAKREEYIIPGTQFV